MKKYKKYIYKRTLANKLKRIYSIKNNKYENANEFSGFLVEKNNVSLIDFTVHETESMRIVIEILKIYENVYESKNECDFSSPLNSENGIYGRSLDGLFFICENPKFQKIDLLKKSKTIVVDYDECIWESQKQETDYCYYARPFGEHDEMKFETKMGDVIVSKSSKRSLFFTVKISKNKGNFLMPHEESDLFIDQFMQYMETAYQVRSIILKKINNNFIEYTKNNIIERHNYQFPQKKPRIKVFDIEFFLNFCIKKIEDGFVLDEVYKKSISMMSAESFFYEHTLMSYLVAIEIMSKKILKDNNISNKKIKDMSSSNRIALVLWLMDPMNIKINSEQVNQVVKERNFIVHEGDSLDFKKSTDNIDIASNIFSLMAFHFIGYNGPNNI